MCGFIAAETAAALGQNAPAPDIHRGSVEMSWHASRVPPPTAIPDPRFAETLTATDHSDGQIWHRLGARVYWTRAMSALVEAGAATWGAREYQTRSPQLPLAFAHETLQHRRALSVVQSIDVKPRGRAVPWVGAGIVVHRTSSRECITSRGRGFAGCARRLTTDTAAVATGGLRIYVDRHAFVSGNAGIRVGRAPTEGFKGQWQLGGGVSF